MGGHFSLKSGHISSPQRLGGLDVPDPKGPLYTFGRRPKPVPSFGRSRSLAKTLMAETETGEKLIFNSFSAETVAEIRSVSKAKC